MTARPPLLPTPRPFAVAILGNDLLLAARPARPWQVVHGALALGFDEVLPVSWGEELVAAHLLQRLAERPGEPVIPTACPAIRQRLLASGDDLAPFLLDVAAPAVAAARYARAVAGERALHVTLVGGCRDLRDPAIDVQLAPQDFLERLAARGIDLERQPTVFDAVLPADRRRCFSIPGGLPHPEAVALYATPRPHHRVTADLGASVADLLLAGVPAVIDLRAALACPSCGGASGSAAESTDALLEQLEPPRSPSPVIDHDVPVSVERDHADPRPRLLDLERPRVAAVEPVTGVRSDPVAARPEGPAHRPSHRDERRGSWSPAAAPRPLDHPRAP